MLDVFFNVKLTSTKIDGTTVKVNSFEDVAFPKKEEYVNLIYKESDPWLSQPQANQEYLYNPIDTIYEGDIDEKEFINGTFNPNNE